MTRRLWWVAPGALALAWLLMLAPGSATVAARLLDLQLRLAWPDAPRRDVAVVLIDDASVRALQARWGSWPYAAATHAALAEFLLEHGARAVVLDVALADTPDPALARAMQSGRVVLGVRPSRAPHAGTGGIDGAQAWPGRTLPAHWPRTAWPSSSALLPMPTAPQASALGMAALPEAEGRIARWPLMHEVQGHGLPALPLAALQAAEPDAPLRYAGGAYTIGRHRWPLDDRGRAVLPHSGVPSVPTIGFLRVGAAAGGITDDRSLREVVAGRIVFVGSSIGGTPTETLRLAAATGALAADRVLLVPSRAFDALLVVIALWPAIALWRRGRADSALDTLWSAGAAGTVLMTSTLGLAAWQLPSHALPALAVCAATWLLAGFASRHNATQADHEAAPRGAAAATRRVTRIATR